MKLLTIAVAGAGFHQHPGKLVQGEEVMLRRQPHNRNHANAVAVLDSNGKQAGWVPREMADILSPALLEGSITVLRCEAHTSRSIDIYFQ